MAKDQQDKRIVGEAYRQLIPKIKEYARQSYPILLVGETGSGKEVFAKLYLSSSPRPGGKRTVNCANITDTLLESEIFGHVKGAFTDAKKDRNGLLRACSKGIVFLDELESASPNFQANILRVVEEGKVKPAGSDDEEQVDFLIIAATNDLSAIRKDLRHRFHVIPVPPLQKHDIPALAKHFLKKPLRREVIEELMARDYPGNVRELEKECQQRFIKEGDDIFDRKNVAGCDLPRHFFDYARYEREFFLWGKYILPVVEKYHLNFKYKYFPSRIVSHSIIDKLQMAEIKKGTSDDPDITSEELQVWKKLKDKMFPFENGRLSKNGSPITSNDLQVMIDLKNRLCPSGDDMPSITDALKMTEQKMGKPSYSTKQGEELKEIIDGLTHGENKEELLPIFVKNLSDHYKMESLGYLLESLDSAGNPPRSAETIKPNLAPLLDLGPKEAEKKFQALYLGYHLDKNSQKIPATARALKMNLETLRKKKRRLSNK